MFVFGPLLLIQHESVLGFYISNLIVEFDEVVFEVLEFEEFPFERGDDVIFVGGFHFLITGGAFVVPGHFRMEF